jgi:hypothetical protein
MKRPCDSDPDRWSEARKRDLEATALCRDHCPVRLDCVQTAILADKPGNPVTGIVGGIYVPRSPGSHLHSMLVLHAVRDHLIKTEAVPA